MNANQTSYCLLTNINWRKYSIWTHFLEIGITSLNILRRENRNRCPFPNRALRLSQHSGLPISHQVGCHVFCWQEGAPHNGFQEKHHLCRLSVFPSWKKSIYEESFHQIAQSFPFAKLKLWRFQQIELVVGNGSVVSAETNSKLQNNCLATISRAITDVRAKSGTRYPSSLRWKSKKAMMTWNPLISEDLFNRSEGYSGFALHVHLCELLITKLWFLLYTTIGGNAYLCMGPWSLK